MSTTLDVDGITIDLVRKSIKNLHLRVYPPAGRVRISAPRRMSLVAIQAFALSRLGWIRKQQARLRAQGWETRREYLDGESLSVWGKPCLLRVVAENAAPSVRMRHDTLLLRVRPGADRETRQAVVAAWYRRQLKAALPPLIAAWEARLSVRVNGFYVRQMTTRWGTCNPRARTIRLNTELAKMPTEYLDYVVLHEMAHLIEPKHNARFKGLLGQFMPQWREVRASLNRRPLGHQE